MTKAQKIWLAFAAAALVVPIGGAIKTYLDTGGEEARKDLELCVTTALCTLGGFTIGCVIFYSRELQWRIRWIKIEHHLAFLQNRAVRNTDKPDEPIPTLKEDMDRINQNSAELAGRAMRLVNEVIQEQQKKCADKNSSSEDEFVLVQPSKRRACYHRYELETGDRATFLQVPSKPHGKIDVDPESGVVWFVADGDDSCPLKKWVVVFDERGFTEDLGRVWKRKQDITEVIQDMAPAKTIGDEEDGAISVGPVNGIVYHFSDLMDGDFATMSNARRNVRGKIKLVEVPPATQDGVTRVRVDLHVTDGSRPPVWNLFATNEGFYPNLMFLKRRPTDAS